jgi:ankyrin repeat protein
MAIKRKDFQKTSSIILEFLLKLPDEETSSRLRDTLLHGLHFLQQYYLILQKRDKEQKPLQWTIERGLSPLTPFREAPDKFEWPWIDVESNKVKQTIPKHSLNNFVNLSPIIVAVREGDLRYVKELLNSEPELIDCVDSFGRDLLTYAVQYQQINILRYLLNEHKSSTNINIQANDGSTCLHRACYTDDGQHCNIEIVRILLENNADVTKQDVHLRSPLHWAVIAENIDCLKLLIEYNVDIHIQDIDGMTPAMWACHLDRYEHFKVRLFLSRIKEKELFFNKGIISLYE